MQLRQASDWVTKHNQRIYLKGSLKLSEIVSDSRSRSSSTSSSRENSSMKMSPPRLLRNDIMLNKKTRLAKGFVCRTWTRDFSPDLPRPNPPLKETLSVRSYVNVSNPLWRQAQIKNHQTTKIRMVCNKNNTKGDAKIDTHETQLDESSNIKEQDEIAKFIEIPSENAKCGETREESSMMSDSSIAESVNLADFLFKSVSLHATKSDSKCKEKSCECLENVRESSHENFPKVERVEFENNIKADQAVNTRASDSNSFPPIVSNYGGKACAVDVVRGSRVHRPNTVNLSFVKLTSGQKHARDTIRRSQSSKHSQWF